MHRNAFSKSLTAVTHRWKKKNLVPAFTHCQGLTLRCAALPGGNWFRALHQTEIPTTDLPSNRIATNGFFDPPELCGAVRWRCIARPADFRKFEKVTKKYRKIDITL